MLYVVSSPRAKAEPEPVPSEPATSSGDGSLTAEPAGSASATEPTLAVSPTAPTPAVPPPAPPSDAKARVIWADQPVAEDDAKRAPLPASAPPNGMDWDEPSKETKAWTLYLALSHDSLSGDDFDDSQAVVWQAAGYAPEVTALPELGSGSGFIVGAGYGLSAERVGSLGFWTGVSYSATWLGVSSRHTPAPLEKAILHDLHFPLRVAYRATPRFVPHFQISYGFGFLAIEGVHGVVNGSTVQFDDASTLLASSLLGAGVGSLFLINEHVAIDAFVGYRVMVVSSIDGSELDGELIASGWMLRLGPAFFF
jgi:hypothetical protein